MSLSIQRKFNKHGKESVKNKESEQYKCYLSIKPEVWDDAIDNKLKGSSRKSNKQSFEDHMYQFVGIEGPVKFDIWNINIQSKIITDTSMFISGQTFLIISWK